MYICAAVLKNRRFRYATADFETGFSLQQNLCLGSNRTQEGFFQRFSLMVLLELLGCAEEDDFAVTDDAYAVTDLVNIREDV